MTGNHLEIPLLGLAMKIAKATENSHSRAIGAPAASASGNRDRRRPQTMTMQISKPVKRQVVPPEMKQQLVNATPQVPATSDEALERHLAEWGGSGGRLIAFNGSTGIHRTLDDNVEVPGGTEFVAFLHETQKGYIKFNDGAPPDVGMVRISENAEVPQREKLGDLDERAWRIGLDGKKQDPWKLQICVPIARNDAGSELFIYVARGVVALNSVEDLLGRWRHHPKRRADCIPVISIQNGTYHNKRFNGLKPKPLLVIVGWVTKTGAPPPPPVPAGVEMNDQIPF
jgi:hypothetical protein